MVDGGSIGSATCPSCGLAVSPGYPKCPKCHAAMPSAPSLGADSRSRKVQGGTAVSSGPGPYLWIAIAGVVVVAAVVVYLARGSDDRGTAAPAPAPAVGPGPAARPASTAPDPFPRTAPDPATTARVDLGAARTRAAAAVGAALESARLWGTVEIVGEQLHIHSAYCTSIGDAHLDAARSAAGAPLFEAVSCFERHGPMAWERPLGAAPP